MNTVTTLIEQKKAQLVVIAHDVDPIEVRKSYLLPTKTCQFIILKTTMEFKKISVM